MRYTHDNHEICIAKPRDDYVRWRDSLGARGFNTISLSLIKPFDFAEHYYTAVMVKPDRPFVGRSYSLLDRDALERTVLEWLDPPGGAQPMYPYVVAANGAGDDTRYAVCFREQARATQLQARLTEEEYVAAVAGRRGLDEMPLWVDCFGSQGNRRYCAIWQPNPDGIAWNAEAAHDHGDMLQQRFDAVTSVGGVLWLNALTQAGELACVYTDAKPGGGWSAKFKVVGRDDFERQILAQQEDSLFPVQVSSLYRDNRFVFAAIYRRSDEIEPRSYRQRGPGAAVRTRSNAAAIDEIDRYMGDYVRSNRIRGAALAVTEGTRLVFTRGYTFAEAGYPDIEPTTLFRMASVAKTFCAIAAWKALLESPPTRDTAMQAILGLTKSDGSEPRGNFAKIRVRHLLECTSGIDQGLFRREMGRLRDSQDEPRPRQPASMATLLALVADHASASPGGSPAYGKTDYILLGEVARVLAGEESFEAALKRLVLEPLQMSRTIGSRSKIENRGADEALHHGENLATAPSAVHDDRRIVAKGYGNENIHVFDGAGGLSAAIVDLARICAMLSCRTANPVLDATALDELLTLASDAYARHNGVHAAYFGFGEAIRRASDGTFRLAKGGEFPGWGVRAHFFGRTGKHFVAIAHNADLDIKIAGAVHGLAQAVDWKNGDLFPHFSMARLSP